MQIQLRSVVCSLIFVGMVSLLCRSQTQTPVLALNPDANTLKIELLQRDLHYAEEWVALPRSYRKNEKIHISLRMTNIGNVALLMRIGNPYVQNRPELTKDSQPLPYLEKIRKRLEALGDYAEFDYEMGTHLQAGESKNLGGGLDLDDWYGDLEVGHYSLCIRHRDFGAAWVGSSTITFEIVSNDAKEGF